MTTFNDPSVHYTSFLTLTSFAPATLANFGMGFDSLGLALRPCDADPIGDEVKIEFVYQHELDHLQVDYDPELMMAYTTVGEFADQVPHEKNLVLAAYKAFINHPAFLASPYAEHEYHMQVKSFASGAGFGEAFQERLAQALSIHTEELHGKFVKLITLKKHMPIGSGLGSSASTIVATLDALNTAHHEILTKDQLLELMGQLEGSVSGSAHYDNVAPAYLGGLRLMSFTGPHKSYALPFPFKHWKIVICYPGIEVKTADARRVLPDSYPRAVVIDHATNLANFIHALHAKDKELLLTCFRDVIATPYREQLLPNMPKLKEELEKAGALAYGISGSGPTFFAVAESEKDANKICQVFDDEYVQNDNGFITVCEIDETGSLTTFIEKGLLR